MRQSEDRRGPQLVDQIMAAKEQPTEVPEGQARYYKTRQMEPNEKGFVGFETVWEPFHKEAEYETPKRP